MIWEGFTNALDFYFNEVKFYRRTYYVPILGLLQQILYEKSNSESICLKIDYPTPNVNGAHNDGDQTNTNWDLFSRHESALKRKD